MLAVVFYLKTRKVKKVYYCRKGLKVFKDISEHFSELEIFYSGQMVKTLSITKLIIWNSGTETLHGKDIADALPLEIKATSDAIILHVETTLVDNKANMFEVAKGGDGQPHTINFDFLEPREGAVFTIVHTGHDPDDVTIVGNVKGFGNVKKRKSPNMDPYNITIFGFFLSLSIFVITVIMIDEDNIRTVVFALTILVVQGLSFLARRLFVARLPNSMKKFDEQISV